jgi:hypothetical protein
VAVDGVDMVRREPAGRTNGGCWRGEGRIME